MLNFDGILLMLHPANANQSKGGKLKLLPNLELISVNNY